MSRAGGAPWPGVRLTGSAGPEVGEDLVDHRRLGDEGDDAHCAVAGRARQRVHLKELLDLLHNLVSVHARHGGVRRVGDGPTERVCGTEGAPVVGQHGEQVLRLALPSLKGPFGYGAQQRG